MKWDCYKNKCLIQIRKIYYSGRSSLKVKFWALRTTKEEGILPELAVHLLIATQAKLLCVQAVTPRHQGVSSPTTRTTHGHPGQWSCRSQLSKICPYKGESGYPARLIRARAPRLSNSILWDRESSKGGVTENKQLPCNNVLFWAGERSFCSSKHGQAKLLCLQGKACREVWYILIGLGDKVLPQWKVLLFAIQGPSREHLWERSSGSETKSWNLTAG